MNNLPTIHRSSRLAALATGSVLAMAAFWGAPANAQIGRPVPGWGNSQTTLTGVVTRDLSGNQFEMRASNGRTYQVQVRGSVEPRSLDQGDRVRVTGRLRNNVFLANDLEFVRDTGNDNGNDQTTLTGVVTRDLATNRFEMRADNGRTYQVRVRGFDEPRSLDRGDRVRVTGRLRNNVFLANDLEFVRDTGNSNWNDQTTLTGVVTRDLSGNQFEMRAGNGRTYQVQVRGSDEPRSLNEGDRVRVTGRLRNNIFVASDLTLVRDRRR